MFREDGDELWEPFTDHAGDDRKTTLGLIGLVLLLLLGSVIVGRLAELI